MRVRGIYAAFAALLFSATLVGNADAYPTTARAATATVTGLYRPLNLNLTLANGTDAFSYCANCFNSGVSSFNYTATYNGSYSGYSLSGLAGNWELSFFYSGIDGAPDLTADANTIARMAPSDLTNSVGILAYRGDGIYTGVPVEDTPQVDDFFFLYATAATDPFLRVSCQDGVATCDSFVVELLQDLKLRGPYFQPDCECDPVLLTARVNQECIDADGACGSVPKDLFRASSVPEPASLALVGLGLAGLALVRRRQQHLHQV